MVPFERQKIKVRQLSSVEIGLRGWHISASSGCWPVQFSYTFPKLRSFRPSQAVIVIVWQQLDEKQDVNLLPSPTKPSLLQAIINLPCGTLPFALSVNGKILKHDVIHVAPFPPMTESVHGMARIGHIGVLASHVSTAEQISVGICPMVRFCFRDLVAATIITVLVEFGDGHVGTIHLGKVDGNMDIWTADAHLSTGSYFYRWRIVLGTALPRNSDLPLATNGWDVINCKRSSLVTRWASLHVQHGSEWNTDRVEKEDGRNVNSEIPKCIDDFKFVDRMEILHTETVSGSDTVEEFEKQGAENAANSHISPCIIASESIPGSESPPVIRNDSKDSKVDEGLEYGQMNNLESSSTRIDTVEFMVSSEGSDKSVRDILIDENDAQTNIPGQDHDDQIEGAYPDNEGHIVLNPKADYEQESSNTDSGEEAVRERHTPEDLQVRTSYVEDQRNQSEINAEVAPHHVTTEQADLLQTPSSCDEQETSALVVVSDVVQHISPSLVAVPRLGSTCDSLVRTNACEDSMLYHGRTRDSQAFQEQIRSYQTPESSSDESTNMNVNVSVNINITFATLRQEERPQEHSPSTSHSSLSRVTVLPLSQAHRQENEHLHTAHSHTLPSLPFNGQLPLLNLPPLEESTVSNEREFHGQTSQQAFQLSSDRRAPIRLDGSLSSSDNELQQQQPHLSLDTYPSTYQTNNCTSQDPYLSLASEPAFPTVQTPTRAHRLRRSSYRQYFRRRDRPGRNSPIADCIRRHSSRDASARRRTTNETGRTSFTNSHRDPEHLNWSKATGRKKSSTSIPGSDGRLRIWPRRQFLSSRTKPSLTAVLGNNEADAWQQTQSETTGLSRSRGPRPISRFPMTFLPSLSTPDSSVDNEANEIENTEDCPPKNITPVHWWQGNVFERIRQVAQRSRLGNLRSHNCSY